MNSFVSKCEDLYEMDNYWNNMDYENWSKRDKISE